MIKKIFSPEQIADLLKNPNVTKCSPKSIGYSKEFKIWAVMQYGERGLTASQIFKEAGFDISTLGIDYDGRLRDWRVVFKSKGIAGLKVDGRGRAKNGKVGRPKTKGVSDADKIKRLEIEVAYLKAENDFLAKLRAQRKS